MNTTIQLENMMKVLITGGGGFLGYRLAQEILDRGTLADADGKQATVSQIVLLDMAFPEQVDSRLKCLKGDLTDKAFLEAAFGTDTASVFHLASVVSGGAEADFDLGMRVNLDGTRSLLDTCRKQARPPRFVFTSSVAVFGGELAPVLDDSTTPNPQGSYGAQKVCCEYLVTDYSRKGFIDGRSLRLPTISVRPGKPNLAASSFASGIIREPLNGVASMCPVSRDTSIWMLSPGKVLAALIHAHDLPSSDWGCAARRQSARQYRVGRRDDRHSAPDRRRQGRRPGRDKTRPAHRGAGIDLAGALYHRAGEQARLHGRPGRRSDHPRLHRRTGDCRLISALVHHSDESTT